ncbi:hypothetical protein NC652_003946 [Populus alba x Populus x berolinensis]|nr:hypothetical protein NC652_003946 [Populus alba x Populus x berolinensis]
MFVRKIPTPALIRRTTFYYGSKSLMLQTMQRHQVPNSLKLQLQKRLAGFTKASSNQEVNMQQ